MPNKINILGQIPWLECVNTKELSSIAASFEDAVFQGRDILVKQDKNSKSVHVLARGAVAVSFRTKSLLRLTSLEYNLYLVKSLGH